MATFLLAAAAVGAEDRGLVLDSVLPSSAPARAGLQEGDRLVGWELVTESATATVPMTVPIAPALSGPLDTGFDLLWLVHEIASRGAVRLSGSRDDATRQWTVAAGNWELRGHPHLSGEAASLHRRASGADGGDGADTARAWGRLADHLHAAGEADREAWAWAEQAEALVRTGRLEEAEGAYHQAIAAAGSERAIAYVTKARALFLWGRGRLEEAEGGLRAAAAACERAWGRGLAWAEAINHLGFFLNRRSRAAEAIELLESSRAVTGATAPASLGHSNTLTNLGLALTSQGRLAEAVALMTEAVEIAVPLAPGSNNLAGAYTNLGIVQRHRGDLEGAEASYRAALAIEEAIDPDGSETATHLSNLSELLNELGRVQEAAGLLHRALAIREQRAPGSLEHAIVLNNLGESLLYQGHLEASQRRLQEAHAILERVASDSFHMGACVGTLGLVEWRRGDLAAATELTERALELFRAQAPGSYLVALALTYLGSFAAEAGDFERAERYLDPARALFETTERDTDVNALGLYLQLAELYRRQGRFEAAERSLERIAAVLDAGSIEGMGRASLASQRAKLALARDDLETAVPQFREAADRWGRLAPESAAAAGALWELGAALRRAGQRQAAVEPLLAALDVLDRQVDRLGATPSIEAVFRARRAPAYVETIEALLELDRPEEAFHVAERTRARVLSELLAERELRFERELTPQLDRRRRELATAYDRALARLARAEGDDRQVASRLLDRLEREREQVAEQVRHASAAVAALEAPQPLTFEQASAALDPGTTALYYVVGPTQCTLFVLRAGEPLETHRIGAGDEALRSAVRDLLREVESPRPGPALRRRAEALYELLVAPAAGSIADAQRLLIVPDGPLHRLPFAALVQPAEGERAARYLVEWKPLHRALSLTVYRQLLERRRRPPAEGAALVAFGDPEMPDLAAAGPAAPGTPATRTAAVGPLDDRRRRGFDWQPLPSTRREVERIAALFPSARVFLGVEATEQRAKDATADGRRVHFATHGYLDEERPLDSALVLSPPLANGDADGDAADNGLLQAWEVFEQVRLDADLVVLSACRTALGRELTGEGLIGLTRAFHFAGARSVAATLWNVADQPTGELMAGFYRRLTTGAPMDAALRQAQLALIRAPIEIRLDDGRSVAIDASAPYFWAGFQLLGDWR
jgi:CHAT domain-containing protein/Tfp pilus assembly protein PilF